MAMTDAAVRKAAFEWLERQVELHGDVLEWSLLIEGFEHEGRRVPLASMQGIFKPAACELPLSIRTGSRATYPDRLQSDHLAYSYRGTDPRHRDNVGLRELMTRRIPLVYLLAVAPGRYLAAWPVFVVADDPARLSFQVQVEVPFVNPFAPSAPAPMATGLGIEEAGGRAYASRIVLQRLHQRKFRERVLDAYRSQCSMCRLKHRELLDAAHIKPDTHGGEPVVANGLALCKIHHAAFDVGVLGVRPDDRTIKVRTDILDEVDGPMLKHGIQGLEGKRLWTPRSAAAQPDRAMLEWKWQRFERAG